MNDSSYETRTRKCCFGCLAAATLAQVFAAAAAGVTVAVLLAICHLHSVVDAGACTVIVLCAVAGAELSAAAADGGTVAVLLSSYLFLLSVAGACSCTVFFLSSCFSQVNRPRRYWPWNLGGARMQKASVPSLSSVAGFCFAADIFFNALSHG